jgi:coenzyme F420-reducing hydrogenase alpha subunit
MNPVTGEHRPRTIHVPVLARVEGEGEIDLRVRKGVLAEVKLRIPEPPRLFEAFLRGRSHLELPDLTARICGICPVAYQMSSARAAERAFGITVSEPVRQLRRLLYCGEWLESHALHVVMLHAPDFLGYPSGLHMAKDHPRPVLDGLELKKIGNELMTLIGGREIHPVSLKVGGFWRTPTTREVRSLAPRLERAGELALGLLRWVKEFHFPELERDYVFVSLRDETGYPLDAGRIVSNHGHSVDPMEWDRVFTEEHVRHSNALHAVLAGHGPYLTGPLARYALNSDRLTGPARDAAHEAGLGAVERNPFRSILVRAVEMVWAARGAVRRGHAGRGCRGRRDRGPTRSPVAPLRVRHRRSGEGGAHRAADGAELAHDRGGSPRLRRGASRTRRRDAARGMRADGAQSRPVHLVRDPLPALACHPRVRPR